MNLIAIGADAHRRHAREHEAFHLAFQRFVVNRKPRRVSPRFGQIGEGEVVVFGRAIAVPRFEQADEKLLIVGSEVVPRTRIEFLRACTLTYPSMVSSPAAGTAK